MKSAAPKLTFRTYSRAQHGQLPATIRLPTALDVVRQQRNATVLDTATPRTLSAGDIMCMYPQRFEVVTMGWPTPILGRYVWLAEDARIHLLEHGYDEREADRELQSWRRHLARRQQVTA